MGIQYHPDLGEALWCDDAGVSPEMVKRRLAVVVVPKACQRMHLTTVRRRPLSSGRGTYDCNAIRIRTAPPPSFG